MIKVKLVVVATMHILFFPSKSIIGFLTLKEDATLQTHHPLLSTVKLSAL
jgi:hypothetical protein